MSFPSRIARKSLLENAGDPVICLAFARFSSYGSHTAAMRTPFAASRFFINICAPSAGADAADVHSVIRQKRIPRRGGAHGGGFRNGVVA